MKKLLYVLISCTLLSACSEYQKALKSDEIGTKFAVGEELYNAEKYAKANRLFKQIVPNYRGKPQAEKLMYLYCKSFYEMGDYHLSGYQFERFVNAYPQSEKVEEAAFLSAKSYYMLSPVFSKDQTETQAAIDRLQQFINNYPESGYIDSANLMVRELDYKLEKKAFETAKQYNTIAPYTGDYQAAIKAFDNFLIEFPGSKLREGALFYRLDSAYKLAINSVEWKKQERLETAQSLYKSFKRLYAESEHIEAANAMNTEIEEALQQYTTNS